MTPTRPSSRGRVAQIVEIDIELVAEDVRPVDEQTDCRLGGGL